MKKLMVLCALYKAKNFIKQNLINQLFDLLIFKLIFFNVFQFFNENLKIKSTFRSSYKLYIKRFK